MGIMRLSNITVYARQSNNDDFSMWYWLQIEKKLRKKQFIEFQYQIRFNNNATYFNRSSFNFSYGKKIYPNLQIEGLYQFITNYKTDQHTFFLGLSYNKRIVRNVAFSYRSAVQHARNYFTEIERIDKPYIEWRNRVRLSYYVNNLFSVSASAEPYLKFSSKNNATLTRIRCVANTQYRFNKYQTFSVFYLVEPGLVFNKKQKTDYVSGIVYQFVIPNKFKSFKKILKPKPLKREHKSIDDDESSGIYL